MVFAIHLLFCALGYLLGSVPFAFLMARLKGVDIRSVGSGNVGATNVFRSVSKTLGVLTFVADALKGFIPAWVFPIFARRWWPDAQWGVAAGLLWGFAAVIGHTWPIFLKFKGGKGVATSAGVLLGVAPLAMTAGLVTWVVLFALTRYVSVASIGAAIAVPTAAWFQYGRVQPTLPLALSALGLLVIYRHKSNIRRLLRGEELRVTRST